MFDVGLGEIAVLVIIGLVIFGDRLPQAAEQVGRAIRQFRQIANGATADLKKELGPEFENLDLAAVNPKTMVRDYLLGDSPAGEGASEAAEPSGAQAGARDHSRAPFDAEAT